MLNLRRRALLDCLTAVLILGASAASAAGGKEPPAMPVTRDKVRLILLDNCVFDEWKTSANHDRIADQCKCAAAKVAHEMSEADIKAFKDKSGRSEGTRWQSAMKYCLNPPRPKPPVAAAAAKVEEPAKSEGGAAAPATPPAAAAPAAAPAGATDNTATGSTGAAAPAQ
jgi:hypothetical protein